MERPNDLFTGVPEADRNTLLRVDDDLLKKVCVLNTYTTSLCNENFWRRRYTQEFGPLAPHLDNISAIRSNYWELVQERKRQEELLRVVRTGNLDAIYDWAEENDAEEYELIKAAIRLDQWKLLEKLLKNHQVTLHSYFHGRSSYDDYGWEEALEDTESELLNDFLEWALEFNSPKSFDVIVTIGKAEISEIIALITIDYKRLEIVKFILEHTGDEHLDAMIKEARSNRDLAMVDYLEEWRAQQ